MFLPIYFIFTCKYVKYNNVSCCWLVVTYFSSARWINLIERVGGGREGLAANESEREFFLGKKKIYVVQFVGAIKFVFAKSKVRIVKSD